MQKSKVASQEPSKDRSIDFSVSEFNRDKDPPAQSCDALVSAAMTQDELFKLFNQYTITQHNKLDMGELRKRQDLKLKKYKESVYFGGMINSKRHGKGIMLYYNGRVYQGDWEADLKHGEGFQKFNNGSSYLGEYVNGKPQGRGVYNWSNGEVYEGQWINGLKHGSGIWRGARGDSYIGQWKFGKADGYGVHTWLNGDCYQGQFKQCLKHGEGKQKFANGDQYIGSYVNGKPEGYGQYYWKNKSYFKGQFKRGLRNGPGVWKRGPGLADKYQGQFLNDKKSGFGIFNWASGNVYKGQFFNDLRHGQGQMIWNDGSRYKGKWEKGIQHGQGQITMPGLPTKKGYFQCNVLVSEESVPVLNQIQQKNLKKTTEIEKPFIITGRTPMPRPHSRQMQFKPMRNKATSQRQMNKSHQQTQGLRRNILRISRQSGLNRTNLSKQIQKSVNTQQSRRRSQRNRQLLPHK